MASTRREVLALMAAAGGSLAVTGALYARGLDAGERPARALAPEPAAETVTQLAPIAQAFATAMPIPPVLRPASTTSTTDYYTLPVVPKSVEILPGLLTDVLTYGGSFPGPTIRARSGRRTVVKQTNRLDASTSMHLHGAVVDPANDGGPMDLVPTGATRNYTYLNPQVASTLWYHDHAHHVEAENVYRGMSGMYLITDDNEAALPLPKGQYDVPIMVRDIGLNPDGSLFFDHQFDTRPQILVNGKPQPYFQVAARKYRLRVLNGSNLRPFEFRLSTGDEFTQIASDRGLLAEPYATTSLPLSPGERGDIVVDFSRYPVGTSVVLQNSLFPQDSTKEIMRFDVVRTAYDTSSVPARLATLPAPLTPTVTRRFELDMDEATGAGHINGKSYDEKRADTTVRWGDTEVWEIKNLDFIPHNFHIHLVDFRVLDTNGVPPKPGEAGLKDTVRVMPNETVRILVTFNFPYSGRYFYHCHLIDHSSMGMMANLDIVRG
ncbi:multicopper oxidase family protein [Streptomyces sp. NPDC012693]|jgi:spore coat protein A|uniref:multicopper oxidase family protein n=1 Tax=unclassified Streptomyces TaxID=2593676 RepID=UPI0020305881|nr:multicopper oxidase domain-containing protein [Streptomyces sp. MSC1_001]